MSRLHEMKIKHQGMSLAEKIACNCELCKDLNVNKSRRKVKVPVQNIVPEKFENLNI